MVDKFDASIFKKSAEQLEEYLQFQRKHTVVKSKKGKGSYSRKQKHKGVKYDD